MVTQLIYVDIKKNVMMFLWNCEVIDFDMYLFSQNCMSCK